MPITLIAVEPSVLMTYKLYVPAVLAGVVKVISVLETKDTDGAIVSFTYTVGVSTKPEPVTVMVWPPAGSAAKSSPA